MAVPVVDMLEVVDIDVEQRGRACLTNGQLEQFLGEAAKAPKVRQASEFVAASRRPERLQGTMALDGVGDRAHDDGRRDLAFDQVVVLRYAAPWSSAESRAAATSP